MIEEPTFKQSNYGSSILRYQFCEEDGTIDIFGDKKIVFGTLFSTRFLVLEIELIKQCSGSRWNPSVKDFFRSFVEKV